MSHRLPPLVESAIPLERDPPPSSRFGKSRALVVGIDAYAAGISLLANAVADARAVAHALADQFQVELLVEQEATRDAIRTWLARQAAALSTNDRLLIYLACHGMSVKSDGVRPDGFLLLTDAVAGTTRTYLPMSELYSALIELPYRHVMVILDCCFAGMFARPRDAIDPLSVDRERYDEIVASPAWQVLAAAAKDQRAFDDVVERDATPSKRSPFADALLDGLRGHADLDDNGLITATELYWYARGHVEQRHRADRYRQTPNLVPLERHEHGEFVFQVAELRLWCRPPVLPDRSQLAWPGDGDGDKRQLFGCHANTRPRRLRRNHGRQGTSNARASPTT